MHLLCIISILSVSWWQICLIRCDEVVLHENSGSGSVVPGSTVNVNGNHNNNNVLNNSLINAIVGNGGIPKGSAIMGNMGGVFSAGLGLNDLSAGPSSPSLNTLGEVSSVGTGQKLGALPAHGHALAGLANLGIVVPGVGQRMHTSMGMGVTNDMGFGNGQTAYHEHYISEHTVMAVFTSQGQVDGPCRYMTATRRQKHQCRNEFGLPETIREARRLATSHCEDQFRYDRWNCTIEITAAAMTHSIARACAEGRMNKCSCGPRKQNRVDQDFQWGGCNDNLKHGKRVTRSFLDLQIRDGDEVTEILRHDSEVGIETVSTLMKDKCKCHGVSGSCSMKTLRDAPINRKRRPKQRRKKVK